MPRQLLTRVGSAMHYDFCPWANRYVYWLKLPIGWVVLAFIASLLLGIYVSQQAYMAAGIVAAVGVIGSLWPWISMMGIRGELSWSPNRCEEDEIIDTTLTITNRWPWPAWGLVVQADDAISNQVDAPGQPISLSKVPAWTRSRFRWNCQSASRGIYPKRSVRLTTAFPFGIWSSSRPLTVEEPLVVWPRTVRLTDVPENSGTQRLGIGGLSQRAGDDGDWMGVRPYREGDSLRQVHWAQTARRDNLIVFERQSRSRQTVSISLDSRAASRCSSEERDWMLRILASLANHLLQHAWNVRIHIGDRWQVLHRENRVSWMDQLAAWEPDQHHQIAPPAFSRDCGVAIVVTSISRSQGRDCPDSVLHEDFVHRFVTSETTRDRSQSGVVDCNEWTIVVGSEADDHLRDAWRQMCQMGSTQEVSSL